jgi:hypothetical protein
VSTIFIIGVTGCERLLGLCGFLQSREEQHRVVAQRPPKKGGPQSEFAWLVDDGVRACQRQRRLPTLEMVQSELATAIAISLRTLQSWRANRYPERYENLRNFARACLQTAPDLGQVWVINLFRAAGMSHDIDQALSDLQLKPRELALSSTSPQRDQWLRTQIIQPDPVFQRVHGWMIHWPLSSCCARQRAAYLQTNA